MAVNEEILAAIRGMSVADLADLVKAIKTEFGIAGAGVVSDDAPAGAAIEGKMEISTTLTGYDVDRVKVIKKVREITELGLREAKRSAESAPTGNRD